MILCRVVLVGMVVVAAAGGAAAHPQRGRQSPFAMGMRFLENIRSGMTSTLQNFFGSSTNRGKEVPQPRPPPHQAPNLDPGHPPVERPQSPPHHQESHGPPPAHFSPTVSPHFAPDNPSSSGGSTSFFKVVHEQGGAAPFPGNHGFSDEGLHPDTFLSGPPPFQGTVEEDHLVSVVHNTPQPLPLQHNHLPQDSFPPHKSSTSFASFGNTASFNLGTFKRDAHDGHAPHPRSILQDPPLPPAADSPHHSLRQDTKESGDHPTVILLSNSRLSTSEPATQAAPPDTPTATLSFEAQRQHHVAKKASASLKGQEGGRHFNSGTKTA